ncbi:MAG: DNA gyrase inhibitor YacG [Rhodobacteraceae bacterium]|nr:DNA gyrase inhibitor YacG [Paracoccaceae bacterium]
MSCPICDKETVKAYRPFCSKRCADVDLGKWFGGDYAVPSQDPEEALEALEALVAAQDMDPKDA